jgi:hypothetical protein
MAFPGTFNFNYYEGDRYEFSISPKNSDGSAFDLSDYNTCKFYIATSRGPGATQYEAYAEVDEGQVVCRILPGVGRDLVAGTPYVYDVEISKQAGAFVFTLLTGNITVTADVSGAV